MMSLALALALVPPSAAPPSLSIAPVLPDERKPAFRAHRAPECSDWRPARARAGKDADSGLKLAVQRYWMLGYITGFNVVGPDASGNLLGTASGDEVYAALDDWCARNPTRSVVDFMRPLAAAIVGRRGIPATTPPVPGVRRQATVVAPTTCAEWARNRDVAIVRLAYVEILYGYLTAYNEWGPDASGDAIGPDEGARVEHATDRWCAEHPAGLLIGVVTPLIADVAAERAAGRLPPGGKRPTDEMAPGPPAGP